jgi:hypothetical protein
MDNPIPHSCVDLDGAHLDSTLWPYQLALLQVEKQQW